MDLTLRHPGSLGVLGVSFSGKSQYIFNFIRFLPELYGPKVRFDNIIWCYGSAGALKDIPKDVKKKITKFIEGVPPNLENLPFRGSKLLILDDLMVDLFEDPSFVNLLSRGVHHGDTSVICTIQGSSVAAKSARNIFLNFTYLCLFPSLRDKQMYLYIARQLAGSDAAALLKCAESLRQDLPFPYLFADLHPLSAAPDWARFRSLMFPSDSHQVFIVSDEYKADVPCEESP